MAACEAGLAVSACPPPLPFMPFISLTYGLRCGTLTVEKGGGVLCYIDPEVARPSGAHLVLTGVG